jgi:glycerol kinase
MPDYIVAIDQSTHNTQCLIFNRMGEIVSQSALKHRQVHPEAGWLENYPLEIWANTQVVITVAMEQASLAARDIAAIGIANQRETTVVWDKTTGRPYYNAIVWRDTRTNDICNQLAQTDGKDRFRKITGLPINPYFSGTKIKWLLDNIPGLRKAAENGEAIFGNMDSWLVWNLTGGVHGGIHITDVTNASRTQLMDLATTNWDKNLCDVFSVPSAMLPTIRPSSDPEIYGYTQPDGPLGGRVPICGILGSQQADAVGHMCFKPRDVKNSYDGASFILMNTGKNIVPSEHGLLTTVFYQFGQNPPIYALEGTIAFTGLLIEWLRDNLKLVDTIAEIESLARTVADNGDIYLVPAFKGLFAPYWRSDARAAIVGLTGYTNRGHIARAALEAIAYQTRDVLEAMIADQEGMELHQLKVGGELTDNDLLMQFQADILGIPVLRPTVKETTALGVAFAAGLAVGFWSSLTEIEQQLSVDKVWYPNTPNDTSTKLYQGWHKAVARTMNWIQTKTPG